MASVTCAPHEKLHPRGKRRLRRQAMTTTDARINNTLPSMDSSSSLRVVRRRGNASRWRWLGPTVVCMVAASRLPMASLVDAASATTTDGVTYCWNVSGSVYNNVLTEAAELQTAQQDECPLKLTMQISKDTFYVNEAIQATWIATLRADANGNFSTNKFSVQQLYLAQDRISQKQAEIVYSKVESCSATAANCDPVTGHTDLSPNVANKPVNFTNGVASFSTDKLVFTSAGSVKLVAHLILPGQNAEQQRMDFALFRTITINDRPAMSPVTQSTPNQSQTTASVEEKAGLSTEVVGILFVCGMVAVALVVVGFAVMRKSKPQPAAPLPDKGPDGRTRHDATSTDLDDEFVMLSNEEILMQSQRPRTNTTNTFLSATTQKPQSMMEESRAKAKAKAEAPGAFAGNASGNGSHRSGNNNAIAADDLASDDHIVDTSNPSSVRHNGHYMEMQPPMPRTHEHSSRRREPREVPSMAASTVSSASSAMNPFVMGRSPRADALASRVADSSAWRVSTELTFDDLRESAQGPALTIDDLLESKQFRKKRASQAISESSEM